MFKLSGGVIPVGSGAFAYGVPPGTSPLPVILSILNELVPENPNRPYDMKQVIENIVDDGDFFEVHE
ncbi:MAG: carboxyl transferase domain-containing protein, partial [Candidatus Sericytochromatia bacterium]